MVLRKLIGSGIQKFPAFLIKHWSRALFVFSLPWMPDL
jgi:hypothetical protein